MAPDHDASSGVAADDYPDPWLDPWPFRRLVLRTPRLELRPDDDAGLAELVTLASRGVHPPEFMPFATPWIDADPRELGRNSLRFHRSSRAELRPQRWTLHFLVRAADEVIGLQSLSAVDFAVTREVSTGSWLGMAYQGQGYGTEMRAAVLGLAFGHLGALTARSGALAGNIASASVSRRLGYQDDGTNTHAVRGQRTVETRFLLIAEEFRTHRPPWELHVSGLGPCLESLGAR
jgi:RimJ/RimL family protein N-acetyltransferase